MLSEEAAGGGDAMAVVGRAAFIAGICCSPTHGLRTEDAHISFHFLGTYSVKTIQTKGDSLVRN